MFYTHQKKVVFVVYSRVIFVVAEQTVTIKYTTLSHIHSEYFVVDGIHTLMLVLLA